MTLEMFIEMFLSLDEDAIALFEETLKALEEPSDSQE